MIDRYDIAYNLKREAEERAVESAATDPGAKESHREMADRDADVAWGARERRCEDGNPC